LSLSERKRLQGLPRHEDTGVRFFGKDFEICDAASFLSTHEDIFVRQTYQFEPDCKNPVIIDAGANVGLAALYFAQTIPDVRVISIEADKHIADLLTRNVAHYALNNVEVLHGAAWESNENLRFSSDHADAGRISDEGHDIVPGIRIRDLLEEQQVDLLKIDIEGSELVVLQDCGEMLCRAKTIFVEYHSAVDQPQSLSSILELLEVSGFRYYIDSTGVHTARPLMERNSESGFDLQLNIYAIR